MSLESKSASFPLRDECFDISARLGFLAWPVNAMAHIVLNRGDFAIPKAKGPVQGSSRIYR